MQRPSIKQFLPIAILHVTVHFYSASPKYFANPDNLKCLGIVKRQGKPNKKLIVAPFPEKQRGSNQFFFQSPPNKNSIFS